MEKYSSVLTSKGQTTIPVQVRNYLNLDTGDEIEFELIDDEDSGKSVVIRSISLFRNLRETLKEVLRRAKEYSNIDDINQGIISIADLIKKNDTRWENYRKEFDTYLNSLDFEVVKIIQTIMYLGRDEGYDKNDSVKEIYRKRREYFDDGWNTQEIEVNQILGKGPSLYGYLLNGLKILKIDI